MTPTDETKPGEWRCQACGTTADEPCRSNGCPDNGSDEEDEGLRARVEALTGERQMLADALRDCMADLAVAQDDAAAARRFLTDERAAVADMEKCLAEAKAQCRRLNRHRDDSEADRDRLAAALGRVEGVWQEHLDSPPVIASGRLRCECVGCNTVRAAAAGTDETGGDDHA